MTNFLKTALFAAAALTFAGAAHADGVHISIDGKDASTVHAEIIKAAQKVCRESPDVATDFIVGSQANCVSDTVEKADAEFRAVHQAPVMTAQLAAQASGQ